MTFFSSLFITNMNCKHPWFGFESVRVVVSAWLEPIGVVTHVFGSTQVAHKHYTQIDFIDISITMPKGILKSLHRSYGVFERKTIFKIKKIDRNLKYWIGLVVWVIWRVWLDLTWKILDSGHRVTWLKIRALINSLWGFLVLLYQFIVILAFFSKGI